MNSYYLFLTDTRTPKLEFIQLWLQKSVTFKHFKSVFKNVKRF